MKSVSVLVPIYNAEIFLEQCLKSLHAQTLRDAEFICINDGSTDGSLKIIQSFLKKDKRFVLLDKKNSGYGDSMNRALEMARGKYVGIVEADDFAEPNMFEKMLELAEKCDAEIVRSNYFYHHDGIDEVHKSVREQKTGHAMSILENCAILLEEPAIWSGLYRKDYLTKNKIRFLPTPGASYQDTGFNFKALAMAKRIAYTKKAYLHYRTDNANSSVKSDKKVRFVQQEFAEIERFLIDNSAPEKVSKYEQVAKFGAYHWNLIRLPKKAALSFMKEMRAEFAAAKKSGLLEKSYFPKRYWTALTVILHFPPQLYYCFLSLREFLKR